MTSIHEERLRLEVENHYHNLQRALFGMVTTLRAIEPGGTLRDDFVFNTRENERIRIAYSATAIHMAITTPERRIVVRVIENLPRNSHINYRPLKPFGRSLAVAR